MISISERSKYFLAGLVLLAGAILSYVFGSYATGINHLMGFPLDDPWIHLQFAKNLHDYGSFSYYKNEMVTAGSTSPLYTILLAIGFFITSNEMVLSYILGVTFFLGAAFFLYRVVSFSTSAISFVLAPGAALIFLVEPRMQWAALSGMETTLFLCLLLAVLYFYVAKKSVLLGVAGGLLVWARPEAVVLFVAIALDVIYHALWVVRSGKKKKESAPPSLAWLRPSVILAFAGFGAYAGFNLLLSGSLFPNTYAAKIAYYGHSVRSTFPSEVFHFLVDGHMVVVAIFAAVGILDVVVRAGRRLPQTHLIPLLFAVGLFLAYWMKLPFLYQEGRYMMPMIPFVILLGISGVQVLVGGGKSVLKSVKPSAVVAIHAVVIVVLAGQALDATLAKRKEYAGMCRYINDRQVRTAKWLHDNTPESAIIGTHDIGAIAFYSGRKIADMVGLVSPEMITRIGSLDRLTQFLVEKHVTYLAVLRNWFEVVNERPVFQTDEREPEIMEVFAFDPQQTHLTSQDVSRATVAAGQYLYQGQYDVALQILQRAVAIDPLNSKVHHLLGAALMMKGDLEGATREFSEALRLYPDFLEARVGLAQVAARGNKPDEAIAQLETISREHPQFPAVYRALADVYNTFGRDGAKARAYMERYQELTGRRGRE